MLSLLTIVGVTNVITCIQEISSNSVQGRRKTVNLGAHIHIFVLVERKNNRFQKELIMQNTNI